MGLLKFPYSMGSAWAAKLVLVVPASDDLGDRLV